MNGDDWNIKCEFWSFVWLCDEGPAFLVKVNFTQINFDITI